ncbi:TRAP dicarboxylate transporter- DctM subunit [Roseobacter sp. SK209-2-6]|uniref:TRAP transporter large permease n=1 Tax=Roseobacter sp. SK209-2-6 TaxID=388739 RepID=UPI0000F3E76A|nr:TRAP transporter large permease subunit [Roseobacter sp. SK209-2-6]EBA16096.1 TRAP dicarboxylate transporter- DctM subunit [Roseobacter sp. SK209-2-6]
MGDIHTIYLVALFAGLLFCLMSGFPVAFVLGGVSLLLAGVGILFQHFDASFLAAMPQRIYAAMTNDVLLAVPLFVFMGAMLERSGIASELLDGIGRLFGKRRGGLGFAITLVGALLAASTGIVGATVTTMALLSLPVMLKWGYSPRLAAGSICAAGTLGQIIPPSLVLVLLADTISSAYQKAQLAQGNFSPDTVSISDLFAGAIVPGILMVIVFLVYQVMLTFLRPESCPPPPTEEAAEMTIPLPVLLTRLVPPLALILGVLGSILGGVATPTESASIGAAGAILLAGFGSEQRKYANIALSFLALAVFTKQFIFGTIDLPILAERAILSIPVLVFFGYFAIALLRCFKIRAVSSTTTETVRLSAMVFMILIGAATLSLVFRGFGGDEAVQKLISSVPGGPYAALAAVLAVMFLLGFILDFIEIIFVIVPTIAPVLLMSGIDPIWLAILISLNLQTSFLTPPFGFALFYFRSAAPPEISTRSIYLGVMPFIGLQLLVLVLVALIPGISIWLPYALR